MDRVRTITNRRMTAVVVLTLLLGALILPAAGSAEVIDRIIATVNGHIILQSDWDEALRYEALLNGRALNQFTDEDRRAVLDRLIDQELLGEQMKSASFQHASESEAAARVAEARKQYPEAATDEGWQVGAEQVRAVGERSGCACAAADRSHAAGGCAPSSSGAD